MFFVSNEEKLIKLEAEYNELVRIMSGLNETNSYYIDKLVKMQGDIAVLQEKTGQKIPQPRPG